MIRILRSIQHSHFIRVFTAGILSACCAAGIWGATYTYYKWTGSAGSDWSAAGNWKTCTDSASTAYASLSWSTATTAPTTGAVVILDSGATGTGAAISITLSEDVTVYNLDILSASNASTINLNGYSLTVSDYFNLGVTTSTLFSGFYASSRRGILTVNGSGTCTISYFDMNENTSDTLTLTTSVSVIITDQIWTDSSGTTTVNGDSSCSFTIPNELNADGSGYSFTGDMSVTVTGSAFSLSSSLDTSSRTFSVTVSSSLSQTNYQLYYKASVTNSGSTESYTLTCNGTTAISSDVSATKLGNAMTGTSKTFTLSYPSSIDTTGDGIAFTVLASDKITTIGTIQYYKGSPVWTGSSSSAWDSSTTGNWSTGAVPDSSSSVTVPAVTTHQPVTSGTTLTAATVEITENGTLEIGSTSQLTVTTSVTVKSGASLTINGTLSTGTLTVESGGTLEIGAAGQLSVTSLVLKGTGTYSNSGTVTFTGTAVYTCALPSSFVFSTVEIASGAALTPSNAMYVSGNWTNNNTFTANSKTVYFTGAGTVDNNASSFYNIVINAGSSTVTLSSDTTVAGTLTVTAGKLSVAGNDLTVAGTTTNTGTVSSSGGSLTFTKAVSGTGTVSMSASATITATAGGTIALLTQSGSGAVASLAAGAATTLTSCTGSIGLKLTGSGAVTLGSGTQTLGAVTVNDGTLTTTGDITCSGVSIASGAIFSAGGDISDSGDWSNSGTFVYGTSTVKLTGTAASAVTGTNTFYNFTYDGSSASASKTIKFEAGKTQTITGKFTIKGSSSYSAFLTTDASSPSVSDTSTWWTLSVPAASANVAVSYAKVSYSTSSNDISGYTDYSEEGQVNSTENWFITVYYWKGGTSGYETSWAKAGNWYKDSGLSTVCTTYPNPANTSLEIYVTGTTYSLVCIQNIEVSLFSIGTGCRVVLGGYTITATTITNSGTIAIDGSVATPLSGSITHDSSSSCIEYYNSSAGITNTSTYAGLGLSSSTGYINLIINVYSGYAFSDSTNGTILVQKTTSVENNCTVTTTGVQTYTGAVTFGASLSSATLNAGGDVTFGSTVDGDTAATSAVTVKTTGTVTFSDAAGGTTSLKSLTVGTSGTTASPAIKINGEKITTSGSQIYYGPVTLGGNTQFITSNSAVTFGSTLDSDSTARTLTIAAGTGAVTFTGAVGSTPPASVAVTCGACTVDSTVAVSGTMTVTNSGVFLTAADADITVASGYSFTQNGTGYNQLAGGITTSGSGGISFATDVYLYGSDTNGMTLGGSGSITCSGDLHIAASTASKTITIASALSAENIVLYGGTLSPGADITALKDLVLLNGNTGSMYKDTATGLTALYAYNTSSPSRSGTASPSLSSFPLVYPDGTTFIDGSTTAFCGAIDGTTLGGRTLTAGQNFYDNGVDLSGTAAWTLKLKDNGNAADAFAEAYNCTVSYCTVTCTTSGGSAWVSAAEGCTDDGSNTDWDFTRPVLLADNAANARETDQTANLSGTYTVYDNVIRVEFVDSSAAATHKLIENSNNEISTAASHIYYYSGSAQTVFSGTYIDADCTTGTDGQGDLSVFYIKAGTTWNTDATGISAGQSDTTTGGIHYDASTDRSGTHKSAVPYLNLPKALSSVYATLRDSHKNRIAHYYTASPSLTTAGSSAGATFTAVADRAAPVLTTVQIGQEVHISPSGTSPSQQYYDAHNFIELKYSEAVTISDGTTTVAAGDTNIRSTDTLGAITTGGTTITVAGLASMPGAVTAGTAGSVSTTVHAMYRDFSLTTDVSDASEQTDRLRIAVAGYVDESNPITVGSDSYYNWTGYITSATTPSGAATPVSNTFITDSAGIALDAAGTSNHALATLTISTTTADGSLYGAWDTSPPCFAPYRVSGSAWNDMVAPSSYEALGTTTSGSAKLDRIEFHMFDNKPAYDTSEDDYTWFSKAGWSSSNSVSDIDSAAADTAGGSRPFASSGATSGGIRYCSLYGAASAFTYTSSADTTVSHSFSSADITGGAQSFLFLAATGTSNATGSEDGLYYAVYLSETDLPIQTTFTVSFNASNCFITDLAGNRITSSATIETVDRTPPEFNMTVTPLGQNQIYVVFSKKINTDSIKLYTSATSYTEYNALTYIPKALEIVTSGTGTPPEIDTSESATVVFSKDNSTGLIMTLSRNAVLSDMTGGMYLKVRSDLPTSYDPLSGIPASVTYIQDYIGNYMNPDSAHAFSDFAVGAIQPQYAYDNRKTDEGSDITEGLYTDGSWAVHDWDADQQNYGTLLSDHDIFISAKLYDGTSDSSDGVSAGSYIYLDNSPDSDAVSTEYNDNSGASWRVWLPDETAAVFTSLAPQNNTGYITFAGGIISSSGKSSVETFTLPVTTDSRYDGWKSGDQISFLFGLRDSSGNAITVKHSPKYSSGTFTGTDYPLYALRLKNQNDITSLDLWSLKLKSVTLQRGGVTILNNVINVNAGEKVVVQVDMPSSGNLNVMVMTLDGNIVTYLQHGSASKGTHYYRWNGKNNAGDRVARGLYFVRVTGSGIDETRKVMCVKE